MRIGVIDGQGGGIGKAIVERLRKEFQQKVEILALGTNSAATTVMLKAGADAGATGENAIAWNAAKVDIIMGAVGIIAANAMMGELTPLMAREISGSPAKKVLVPINRCGIVIAGVKEEPLPVLIDEAVNIVKKLIGA